MAPRYPLFAVSIAVVAISTGCADLHGIRQAMAELEAKYEELRQAAVELAETQRRLAAELEAKYEEFRESAEKQLAEAQQRLTQLRTATQSAGETLAHISKQMEAARDTIARAEATVQRADVLYGKLRLLIGILSVVLLLLVAPKLVSGAVALCAHTWLLFYRGSNLEPPARSTSVPTDVTRPALQSTFVVMPGWTAAYDRRSLDWKPELVGSVVQWVRRGVAFLDVFRSKGRRRGWVALVSPRHGVIEEIEVPDGETLKIAPWAFVAAEVKDVSHIRLRNQWTPLIELFLRGRRRFYEVRGPARVRVWLGQSGQVLRLRPGTALEVLPQYIGAHGTELAEELVGLPLRHRLTRRGSYLKRLYPRNGTPAIVVLGHPHDGADRVVVKHEEGGISGLLIDLLTNLPLR